MGAKSQFPDKPKTLKDDVVKQERQNFLRQSHVAPLTRFVDGLRDKKSEEPPRTSRKITYRTLTRLTAV